MQRRITGGAARCSCLVLMLLALLPATLAAAAGPRLGVIALEDEPAPVEGASYRAFFGISLNDVGDIGISAGLTGGAAHGGLFVLRADGGLDAILSSDPPPAEPGDRYAYLGTPELNDAGDFAFGAGIGDVLLTGAWLWSSDSQLTVIAAVGDPIPGLEDTTYDENNSRIQLNDAGQVLLGTKLQIPIGRAGSALFLITGDTQEIVAMSGDPAPIPGGARFTAVDPEAHFNDAADTVFFADTDDVAASRGVFVRRGDTLSAVALEGQRAPVEGDRPWSRREPSCRERVEPGSTAFRSGTSA